MHTPEISGSRLARLAVVGLFGHVACAAARITVSLAHLPLLRRWGAGHEVPDGYFTAVDDALTLISLVELVAWFVSIVGFVLWLHTARLNLRAAGVRGLEYGPGWAIGAWFVPLLNFFAPYLVTREVWEASGPAGAPRRRIGPVEAWWGAWALMWVLLYPVRKGVTDDASVTEWLAFTWWSIGASVAAGACAWLAVRLVRDVMARQRTLFARLADAPREDAEPVHAGGEAPHPAF